MWEVRKPTIKEQESRQKNKAVETHITVIRTTLKSMRNLWKINNNHTTEVGVNTNQNTGNEN